MAMTLQAALDIAARYTDSKNTDNGYNCVLIRDGMVRATNGNSGCEIPCSDVEGIDFALDCAIDFVRDRVVVGDFRLLTSTEQSAGDKPRYGR